MIVNPLSLQTNPGYGTPSIQKLIVMATHGHLASQHAGCTSFNYSLAS